MKREKYKSNKALALFLCVLVLVCSIGLALARGNGDVEPYRARDLTLTQGQRDYDLLSGINYDTKKYVLTMADKGDFDINTPGTYEVQYQLTPVLQTAAPLPSPNPAEPAPEANTPAKPGDGVPDQNNTPAKPGDTIPDQNNTPAKPGDTILDQNNTPAKPGDTTPDQNNTPAKPGDTTPDQNNTPAKPGDTSPDQNNTVPDQGNTVKPEKPVPSDQGTSAPKSEKSAASDQSGAPAKPEKPVPSDQGTSAPKPEKSAASDQGGAPAKLEKPTASDQGSTPVKPEKPSPSDQSTSAPKPEKSVSSDQSTSASKSEKSAFSDHSASPLKPENPAAPEQGSSAAKRNGNSPSGISGYGIGPSVGLSLGVVAALPTTPSAKPALSEPSTAVNPSGTSEDNRQTTPGVQPAMKPEVQPDKTPKVKSKITSGIKPETKSETKPEVKPEVKPETAPETKPEMKPEVKPETTPETKPETPPEEKPAPAPAPEVQPTEEAITFSRNVVVKPAVTYQDLRLDVNSEQADLLSGMSYDGKNYSVTVKDDGGFSVKRINEYNVTYELSYVGNDAEKPGGQTDKMGDQTGKAGHQISIVGDQTGKTGDQASATDDQTGKTGDNNSKAGNQISTTDSTTDVQTVIAEDNNSKASDQTGSAADGNKIGEFQRYVWVTAPGVSFDAPPLTVDPSKDYDLFDQIKYDKTKYDLSLVDPNAFDPTKSEPQRVMYRLSLHSDPPGNGKLDGAVKKSDESTAQPADQAADQSTGQPGDQTAMPPEDQSQRQMGQNTPLVAAVFGREVTVEGGAFVHIDAPPLVITQGAIQTVNLLEGVTATDEKGNAVKLEVADRSQLDKGIKAAESEAPPASIPSLFSLFAKSNAKAPADLAKSNEKAPASVRNAPKEEAESASPADGVPLAGSASKAGGKPTGATASSIHSTIGAVKPSADNILSKARKPSADMVSGGAMKPSIDSTSSGGAVAPPVIELSPDATLPPNLAPGTYTIYVGAFHPETGAFFSEPRILEYRDAFTAIKLVGPDGATIGNPGSSMKITAIQPLQELWNKGQMKQGVYTIVLQNNYNVSTADIAALSTLNIPNPNITIKISGKNSRPDLTDPQWAYKLNFPKDGITKDITGFKFPASSDSSQTAKFMIENVKLQSVGGQAYASQMYLIAQGSQLTVGEGVSLASETGVSNYVVGGYRSFEKPDDTKSETVHTNVTVNSGLPRDISGAQAWTAVYGGNYNIHTEGTTQVTIGGDVKKTQISRVFGGGSGDGVALDPSKPQVVTVACAQTGLSKVIINGGTVLATVYGGSGGPQTGDCVVRMTGGKINALYGGAQGLQYGSTDVMVTGGTIPTALYGGGGTANMGDAEHPTGNDSTLVISGSAVTAGQVIGGGSSTYQYGTGTVDLIAGTVASLAGTRSTAGAGNITVNIKGGTIKGDLIGALDGGGFAGYDRRVYINVNQSQKALTNVYSFDQLNLADNVDLSIENQISNWKGFLQFEGIVSFGTNSTLSINESGAKNQVGGLDTHQSAGGAALILPRQSPGGNPPLLIRPKRELIMPEQAHPLKVKFSKATADGAATGDLLIHFFERPEQATKIEGFQPDFPKGLILKGYGAKQHGDPDKDKEGNIYLTHTVGLQDLTKANAPITYYGNVASALADATEPDDYTLTVRKDQYSLTQADGLAIAAHTPVSGQHITFTGKFTSTAPDVMALNVPSGTKVSSRTVLVGPDLGGATPIISFQTDTNVENMSLSYTVTGGAIYANGHKLYVGANVQILSTVNSYPLLYGGAAAAAVDSTNLELHGGNFSGIYGGGQGTDAGVRGDTTLVIAGGGLHGPLYGGGQAGNVGGSTHLTISGGELTLATPTSGENLVIGGGDTGSVGRGCSITITGGKAYGKTTVAGCDKGSVTGPVSIAITKKLDPDHEIHLPYGNVYGGALNGGTVTGTTAITLTGGTDYGVISGGGNPSFQGWSGGKTAYSSVSGEKSITLLGGSAGVIEMEDVVNFTACNLGRTGDSPNAIAVNLKGVLDSDSSASSSGFSRIGALSFYNSSMLNMGKEPDGNTHLTNTSPHVGDIHVADPGSHLHIFKTKTGTTYPMYVSKQNTSTVPLTLGVLSDAADSGSNGDQLMKYPMGVPINLEQYLSDSQDLALTTAAGGNTIQYGKQTYPTATLKKVLQAAPDINPGETVTKTLTFDFNGKGDESLGGQVGSFLDSAYVDTNPTAPSTWTSYATIPADNLGKVNLAQLYPDSYTGNGCPIPVSITEATDQSAQYYYVHVQTKDKAKKTVTLDVNSPKSTQTCRVSQNGNGDYTFELTVQDGVPKAPSDPKPGHYSAFGLYQIAWTLGDAKGPFDAKAEEAALATPMTPGEGGSLHDIQDISDGKFAPRDVTFVISKKELEAGGKPLDSKVVYVYIKDKGGNTRRLGVALSQSIIDVTIPYRAGVIALRGGTGTDVVAPRCFVKNNGRTQVKAEIVQADFPSGTKGDLEYTGRQESYGPKQIDLEVAQAADPLHRTGSAFPNKPVKDISADQSVLLGTMAAGSASAPTVQPGDIPGGDPSPQLLPYVYFTFAAQFSPNIVATTNWSTCSLGYRFTLVPPAPTVEPSPASATDK